MSCGIRILPIRGLAPANIGILGAGRFEVRLLLNLADKGSPCGIIQGILGAEFAHLFGVLGALLSAFRGHLYLYVSCTKHL